jgi:hypothetical protein
VENIPADFAALGVSGERVFDADGALRMMKVKLLCLFGVLCSFPLSAKKPTTLTIPRNPVFYRATPVVEVNWVCNIISPDKKVGVLKGKFQAFNIEKSAPVKQGYAAIQTTAVIEPSDATNVVGTFKINYDLDQRYSALLESFHRGDDQGYVEFSFKLEEFKTATLLITDNVFTPEIAVRTQGGYHTNWVTRKTELLGFCTLDNDPRSGLYFESSELPKKITGSNK